MRKLQATDQDIIEILSQTGHLEMPFGKRQMGDPGDLDRYSLDTPEMKKALASYQSFHSAAMEPAMAYFHPGRVSASVVPDGEAGPATRALLAQERCMNPDYQDPDDENMALGSGNWKSCHQIGNFHAATVLLSDPVPGFLQPHWDTIWKRVVEGYAEIGLALKKVDSGRPNIKVEFVPPKGGWIGLAIVGRGQSCGDSIWAKFNTGYKPANLINEWTTLFMHEFGHNCGLGHSSGGIMNPYIIRGLPNSWKNDPSYNLMAQRFGGKPVPTSTPPGERTMVLAYKYPDGRLEEIAPVPDYKTPWPN